ncbi:hypothetical protein CH262_25800 [Rhodococcus sp. 05-2255-1e]|nr:hypothetical protein CH262_25800 [Rhodococcus sp. 05-2255-1e]
MSNLAEGQLHCSRIRLKSKRSLDQLAIGLKGQLYPSTVPSRGWGSVHDDADDLRKTSKHRPAVHPPLVAAGHSGLPRMLKARYYWDAVDVKAKRVLANKGATADPLDVHTFNAVDLVIAKSGTPHVYEGVFTSRNETEIARYVNDGLRQSFAAIDSSSTVEMDSSDFIVESDFYMWLVHRYDGDPKLDTDLKLEVVRSLSSEDGLSRPLSLASGAQMDRAELAAAVLQRSGKLGPAQFAVYSSLLDLTLELELHPDGSFQIIIGKCFYRDRQPRHVIGPRLVDDAVYKIIPAVISAYSTDLTWPTPGYDALMDKAKKVLIDHAK